MLRSPQILTVLSRKAPRSPLGSYAKLNTLFHANFSSKTPKPTKNTSKKSAPRLNAKKTDSNYEDKQTRLFGGIGRVSPPFDELAPSRPFTDDPHANDPEYEAEQTRLFGGIGRVSPPFDELASSRALTNHSDAKKTDLKHVPNKNSLYDPLGFSKNPPAFDKPALSETNEPTSPSHKL